MYSFISQRQKSWRSLLFWVFALLLLRRWVWLTINFYVFHFICQKMIFWTNFSKLWLNSGDYLLLLSAILEKPKNAQCYMYTDMVKKYFLFLSVIHTRGDISRFPIRLKIVKLGLRWSTKAGYKSINVKEKKWRCGLILIAFKCSDNVVITQGCENLAKREACNRPVS